MMYNLCDQMDRILCVFVEFSVRVQNSPSNQMLFRRISSQVSLEKGFIVSSCTARCQQHKSEWMGSLRVPCITSFYSSCYSTRLGNRSVTTVAIGIFTRPTIGYKPKPSFFWLLGMSLCKNTKKSETHFENQNCISYF